VLLHVSPRNQDPSLCLCNADELSIYFVQNQEKSIQANLPQLVVVDFLQPISKYQIQHPAAQRLRSSFQQPKSHTEFLTPNSIDMNITHIVNNDINMPNGPVQKSNESKEYAH
jgi:hypothetical protein